MVSSAEGQTMRAVVADRYGGPEVLRFADVAVPTPGPGEVRIRIEATSINLSDWEGLVGSPYYARIGGLRAPARPILGSDIAGHVEAVGPDVTEFAVGDAVYGDNLERKGGFAAAVVAPVSVLAPLPAGLSFAAASTVPQAGSIAVAAAGLASAGDRVALNGGGGGTGAFAIPLLKAVGAHVTGVDNVAKLEFMRSLGADAVVDHRREDYTRAVPPFDLIVDLVARRSVFAYRRALADGGRYACVGGPVRTMLRVLTAGSVIGRLSGRRIGVLAVPSGPEHFAPLGERVAAGEIDAHIDRRIGLDEVPEALAAVGAGEVLGKVVVEPS
ncbi:MAG: NAD(P)-dependent alcohol dehydrogenase [Actinomycetota bacterium]